MTRLLAPRWLAGHLLVAVAAVVQVLLGRWQLHRAEHTHSLQNWSYAVEWVLFALFTVVAYARFARDEAQGRGGTPAPARHVPAPAAAVAVVTDDEDPELAEYNRYLARLNAQSSS